MQAPTEVKMDSEDKFKTLLKSVAQHKDMFTQVFYLSGSHEWHNIQQMLLDYPTDLHLADPLVSRQAEKSSDEILAASWAIVPIVQVKTVVQEKIVTSDAQCTEENKIST